MEARFHQTLDTCTNQVEHVQGSCRRGILLKKKEINPPPLAKRREKEGGEVVVMPRFNSLFILYTYIYIYFLV